MSAINLNKEKLKSLSLEILSLDNSLLNSFMPEIESELTQIKGNIKNDSIHNLINVINQNFQTIKEDLKSDLPKLENFIENQLKDYSISEEEAMEKINNVLNKMNGFSNEPKQNKKEEEDLHTGFWAHLETFGLSALSSFLNLGEGVVDSHIYGTSKILQIFGLDDQWAEDAISYEVIDYDKWVGHVSPDIAYGTANSIGDGAGKFGGYMALSSVPFVGTALCAIGGAGVNTEDSINKQKASTGSVNDWQVFGESLVGSAEGYAAGKMKDIFKKPISNLTAKTGGEKILSKSVSAVKQGGLKSGWEVIKNTPKYAAKDSRIWTKLGANDTNNALAKILGYETDVSSGNILGDVWTNMGVSGINTITNIIK